MGLGLGCSDCVLVSGFRFWGVGGIGMLIILDSRIRYLCILSIVDLAARSAQTLATSCSIVAYRDVGVFNNSTIICLPPDLGGSSLKLFGNLCALKLLRSLSHKLCDEGAYALHAQPLQHDAAATARIRPTAEDCHWASLKNASAPSEKCENRLDEDSFTWAWVLSCPSVYHTFDASEPRR